MRVNSPVIESGVPIPKYHYACYGFRNLKIGQDLLFPNTVYDARDFIKIRTAASTFRKRNPGFNFTARKTNDGLRVWRIK